MRTKKSPISIILICLLSGLLLFGCSNGNPSHDPKPSEYLSTTPSVKAYELSVSKAAISSSGSYTTAEGTIKNNGKATVSFVKIKGSFINKSGETVDTDWTYAVGSEGLAPGETAKWRMSVEKDRTITSCSVSVIDYK